MNLLFLSMTNRSLLNGSEYPAFVLTYENCVPMVDTVNGFGPW